MEAFAKSGLTQSMFARRGVNPTTFSGWVCGAARRGERGLEPRADGPGRRRGAGRLPDPVKQEVVAVALVGTLLLAVIIAPLVLAGDETGLPSKQEPIPGAFIRDLAGTWRVESRAAMGVGHGRVTFALGLGGTVLIGTYENTTSLEGGGSHTMLVHSVIKTAEGGSQVTRWRFDDESEPALVLSGKATEAGWDITGHLEKFPDAKIRMEFKRPAWWQA